MGLIEFFRDTLEEEYRPRLYAYLDGLTNEELNWRPNPEANSIAFIVWHTTKVEDGWFHPFAQGNEILWLRDGWHAKLGIPEDEPAAGYSTERLGQFPELSMEPLKGYFEAVRRDTLAYLDGLSPDDLDVSPGRAPFPGGSSDRFSKFTIRRMFRQVTQEMLQHLGQVGFVRGLQRGLDG